jgi:two-component system, LytTR family, sensor kinase
MESGHLSHGWKPESRQWIWAALFWFGFGLVNATQNVLMMRAEGMHHSWTRLFWVTTFAGLPWALATPSVLRLGSRFYPLQWRPWTQWAVHLLACASLDLLYAAWDTWLEALFNPYAVASPSGHFVLVLLNKFYNGILSSLVLYTGLIVVGYAINSRARLAQQQTETARLNEQLSRAQLHALRQQIEPHFLFNTLNAVSGLVREGRNDDAVTMIAGLSDFLRRVLEDSPRQQVPLGEEVEFAQKYLDIQKVRFADRLQLQVDVPRELYSAQVPSLILQPMVENAIKHGISQRAQGGWILIAASLSRETLTLSVANDGPSLPVGWETSRSGIGIANVRTRLQSLYGQDCQLRLQNREGGGVSVSLSLPFREN